MSAGAMEPLDRHCWVCFAMESEDRAAEWVSPCRCSGSTKWIHQSCLQRWLDEKQKGSSTGSVNCPQCGTEYRIIFPKIGPLVYFLQQVDRVLSKVSPFAAAGIVVGTVYWSAVTYGAVTVMQTYSDFTQIYVALHQLPGGRIWLIGYLESIPALLGIIDFAFMGQTVVGHKKGLDVMERADPLFLLMGLPTIPIMLVLGKMIRWEDYVLRMWHKYSSKLQALNALLLGIGRPLHSMPIELHHQSDHLSISRTLCGALVFPSIANLVGRMMFRGVNSSLQRTILGGIAFIAIKGSLKVYYKQQQYNIQSNRRILNYQDMRSMEEDVHVTAEDTEDSGNEGNVT